MLDASIIDGSDVVEPNERKESSVIGASEISSPASTYLFCQSSHIYTSSYTYHLYIKQDVGAVRTNTGISPTNIGQISQWNNSRFEGIEPLDPRSSDHFESRSR